MNEGNNVNIGTIGNGNTLHINQQQSRHEHLLPEPQPVEYVMDEGSVQRHNQRDVRKGTAIFFGSLLLPALAIAANFIGILSYLGIKTFWALAITGGIALVVTALTARQTNMSLPPIPKGESRYRNGKWVQRDENGDYITYLKSAPCSHPKCSGTIEIEPAPARERHNHELVGRCSKGGKQHTYTVDFYGTGRPYRFNWDPLEQPKT